MLCTLKITLAPSFLLQLVRQHQRLSHSELQKWKKISQIIISYKNTYFILCTKFCKICILAFTKIVLDQIYLEIPVPVHMSIPTPRAIILILFWLWIPNIHRLLQKGTVLVFFMK